MKMRLSGTDIEISAFVESLREHYEIVTVSAFYPNKRSKAGRRYIEVKMKKDGNGNKKQGTAP